jgi:DNA-binding NtrC family response regulator
VAKTGDEPEILVVEDDPALARLYLDFVELTGGHGRQAGTLAAARRLIAEAPPAIVLLDLGLPDGNGHALLTEIRAAGRECQVIVMTASGSINTAVESMRLGAYDFLVKPFNPERLKVTLRNALDMRTLKRVNRQLAEEAPDRFQGFIGASPAMQAVYRLIRNAAPSRAPVFITGESGTGKELTAEAIHRLSPRAGHAFVALNCAAMPRDLVESELFGHVRGAFTGASGAREGIAARADGGTLFLDEIGEMDLGLQAKLLRFAQSGEFTPVGSDQPRRVDVRLVCATNREPLAAIRAGTFREDLYWRLAVVPIELPPLRDRGADVILLARHGLNRFGEEEGKRFDGFDAAAEAALMARTWPGNVRQLLNLVRNIAVMNPSGRVTLEMLPPSAEEAARPVVTSPSVPVSASTGAPLGIEPLWRVERAAIEAALAVCGGNVNRAAAFLEVDASTIYRRRKEWAKLEGERP